MSTYSSGVTVVDAIEFSSKKAVEEWLSELPSSDMVEFRWAERARSVQVVSYGVVTATIMRGDMIIRSSPTTYHGMSPETFHQAFTPGDGLTPPPEPEAVQ